SPSSLPSRIFETRNLAFFSLPPPWSVISTQARFQSCGNPGERQKKMLSINLASIGTAAAAADALEGAASATSWRGAVAGAAGRARSGRTTGSRTTGSRGADTAAAGAGELVGAATDKGGGGAGGLVGAATGTGGGGVGAGTATTGAGNGTGAGT